MSAPDAVWVAVQRGEPITVYGVVYVPEVQPAKSCPTPLPVVVGDRASEGDVGASLTGVVPSGPPQTGHTNAPEQAYCYHCGRELQSEDESHADHSAPQEQS